MQSSIFQRKPRRALFGMLATSFLLGGAIYAVEPRSAPSRISPLPAEAVKPNLVSLREMSQWRADKQAQQQRIRDTRAGKLNKGAVSVAGERSGSSKRPKTAERRQAWLNWYLMHSYPNDTWDATEILRGAEQRARMPAWGGTSSGGSSGGLGRMGMVGTAWPGIPAAPVKWEFVGPRDMKPTNSRVFFGQLESRHSGRINHVAYNPSNPDIIYLAAPTGGVWKSVDGGANWSVLTDDIFPSLEVGAVAVSPANGDIVLAGTGDYPAGDGAPGTGMMRSTDGGVTWARATGVSGDVSDIAFDPDTPDVVLATTAAGLFRSTNAGATWTQLGGGNFSRIAVAALDILSNKRYIYVSAPGSFIFRSQDHGVTWTSLQLGLPGGQGFNTEIEVAASPVNPTTVYYVDCNSGLLDGRILRSDSAGDPLTWYDVTGNLPDGTDAGNPGNNWNQCWYDIHLTTSFFTLNGQKQDLLYFGGLTLSGSVGGVNSWQDMTFSYVLNADAVLAHTDQHFMASNPADPTHSIIANDGGVFGTRFNPATGTWSLSTADVQLNRTLGVTQFYHGAWHPTDPTYMMGGTQDNSTPHSRKQQALVPGVPAGDLDHWDNVAGGDGFACVINQVNPQFQYATSQFNGVFATRDGWVTSRQITPNFGTDRLPFFSVMNSSPAAPNIVYVLSNFLWRWDENTQTWTKGTQEIAGLSPINPNLFTGTVVAPAPSDARIVYTGSQDGRIWMVRYSNAADPTTASWQRLDLRNINGTDVSMFPNAIGSIFSISVNPANPFDIIVGVGQGNTTRLWRCRNTNDAFNGVNIIKFVGVGGLQGSATALPLLAPNTVDQDPADPFNTYYVGNDTGVYVTKDGGSTWFNAGTSLGLPPVSVREIKAVRGTGFLNVATYGRGMWRIPLSAFSNNLPSPFQVTPSLRRVGGQLVTNLVVRNLRKGDIANIRVSSGSLRPSVGTPVNATGVLPNLTPATLTPNATGTATINFPATAGRPGTAMTLRVTFATSLGNYINEIPVRLP